MQRKNHDYIAFGSFKISRNVKQYVLYYVKKLLKAYRLSNRIWFLSMLNSKKVKCWATSNHLWTPEKTRLIRVVAPCHMCNDCHATSKILSHCNLRRTTKSAVVGMNWMTSYILALKHVEQEQLKWPTKLNHLIKTI